MDDLHVSQLFARPTFSAKMIGRRSNVLYSVMQCVSRGPGLREAQRAQVPEAMKAARM